jgi:hypothetical protein
MWITELHRTREAVPRMSRLQDRDLAVGVRRGNGAGKVVWR